MPVYTRARLSGEAVYRSIKFGGTVQPPPPETERNALLQPYASSSFVNTPIGDAAQRGSSGLSLPTDGGGRLKVDPIFLTTGIGGTTKTLTGINYFYNNSSTSPNAGVKDGNGNGYKHLLPGNAPAPTIGIQVNITNDWIHNGYMNGLCVAPDTSGRYVYGGQSLDRRLVTDNPKIAYYGVQGVDIYGDGRPGPIAKGHQGHGGSGLPTFGLTLRQAEWDAKTPPQHALALNIHGKYLSATAPNGTMVTADNVNQIYTGTKTYGSVGGWKEPADRADGGYWNSGGGTYYGGDIETMKQGTLLALPKNYNFVANGITDTDAKNLGWTMQNFGLRIVDITGIVDTFAISAESTLEDIIFAKSITGFHAQMLKMIVACDVIEDDTLGNWGGAGTRLVDPPPELILP